MKDRNRLFHYQSDFWRYPSKRLTALLQTKENIPDGGSFQPGFPVLIEALNNEGVEYILVGGYAVILHGYIRSKADIDVWVNKTYINIKNLKWKEL